MGRTAKEQLEYLAAVPLFSACSKKDLRQLYHLTDQVTVPDGFAIVTEGQNGQEFFVVLEGSVKVKRKGRTIRTMGPGESFGELAILVDQPRSATVTADGETTLLVLRRPAFKGALMDMPGIAPKILESVAARMAADDAS